MRKFIFLFLVLFSSLPSEELITTYLTSENDSLSLVEGVVNAQNGMLVQIDKDIKIQGSDPLELIRYYDGGHHYEGIFGYGVGLSFPIILHFSGQYLNLKVEQREGGFLPFTLIAKKNHCYEGKIKSSFLESEYTNCCEALLRGENDLTAMTVQGTPHALIIDLGNGTKRHYARYENGYDFHRLCIEERSNGNVRHFHYNDRRLPHKPTRIWITNKDHSLTLNWINFEYEKNELKVTSSNGEEVCYQLITKSGLTSKTPSGKTEGYKINLLKTVSGKHISPTQYDSHTRYNGKNAYFDIPKIIRPDGRSLSIEYDSNERVKALTLGGFKKPLYTFDYHTNYTIVKDGLKNVKQYDFKNKRLHKITESHRTNHYLWSKNGQLQTHIVKDTKTNIKSVQEYTYDPVGNITEARIKGNITQKGTEDQYIVRYSYSGDGRNNRLSENHNCEREFTYTYVPETNLIARKLTFADHGFVEREFYQYDKNAILTQKIIDDGGQPEIDDLTNVSYRLITEIESQLNPNMPGMTHPKVIKDWYVDLKTGQKHLLKMVEKFYIQGDLVAEEKNYDSNGIYCFSHFFEYNEKKELVREINSLGHVTVFEYDENRNKVSEEKVGSNKKNRYVYNAANWLVKEIEEHADGLVFTTSHTYDVMGHRISTKNQFGHTTTFHYDAAGRVISTCDVLGQQEHKEYDAKGNIIRQIDKDGHTTSTTYNLHGKPLEITYDDDTSKRFAYNLQGHLIQEWERDNRSTAYEVDYQGNPTKLKIYGSDGSLKKELNRTYKGSKLTSETDAMGSVTSYKYDGAGRKIAMTRGNQATYYEYDSLGFLTKTTDADSVEIKIYDFLGRVTEERTEDLFGIIYAKSQMSYDINGNCTSRIQFKNANEYSESKTVYNSRNLPVALIDAMGNQTTIAYHYTDHLEKEVVDPMGRKEIIVYDKLNRVSSVRKTSANGEELSFSSFAYDGRNNKITQHEKRLCQGQDCGLYTISSTYDAMGHKVSEIEQNDKKTTYIYKNGKLHQTHKPDGVVLTYLYDSLGCLQELISSEGTIHYLYTYDLNDNLLQVEDKIQNTTTTRSYDALNRLIFEKQATGFEVFYTYDLCDRLKEMEFQEEKITYGYSPTSLTSSSRYKKDNLLYAFAQEVNWIKKPTLQTFPNGLNVSYEWDNLNRCSTILSSAFSQSFAYNEVGNIISSRVIDPEGTYDSTFSYDDLNQITKETGHFNHTYIFDSLNNRRNKNGEISTIDDLNRLTSDGTNNYGSDKNGYRISKEDIHYSYDALGRLTSVLLGNEQKVTYTYDSFSRRMERISNSESVKYLYQFDTEIGAITDGKITEFKAIHGQFSPFAIELNDQIYTPIRNHRGDICVLLDGQQKAVSTYRYDAFGEFSHYGSVKSPWLFSSQRYDESTENYHFINREYDSKTGRWLTPDPLGFEDGCNLYAYVHNNPLIYVDPYGLWGESIYNSNNAHPSFLYRFQGACQMVGGLTEMVCGAGIASGSGGLAAPVGALVAIHGSDHFCTGFRKLLDGTHYESATSQTLQKTGMSRKTAEICDGTLSIAGTTFGIAAIQSQTTVVAQFKVPPANATGTIEGVGLSRGAESLQSGTNLNGKLSQLQSYQRNAVKMRVLPDGRIRYLTEEIPSSTTGATSGACRVLEWNPLKCTTRTWHECHDHLGNINRVHPKTINGQSVNLPHYPPTAKDLLR